jgi:L-ascorbate metabolism protein UlaG (beta-lactamase superfamily)
MEITHYGHACVLLQTGDTRILIDPGTYSQGFEELTDLAAVFITHQHADHLDVVRLPQLLTNNPGATVYVDALSMETAKEAGLAATVLAPGEQVRAGSSTVEVVGGEHALIHKDIPTVPNNALVFDDGAFYHPGDSFALPGRQVDVFGLPVSGPWLKLAESIDFLRDVAPRVAVPIHERALANTVMAYGILPRLAPEGTTFTPLAPGMPTAL